MALILPSRATRIVQPTGPVEFDKSYGLTPIGMFLGSAGAVDIVTGQRFTRGSALAIAPSQIGLGARQNAVNTSLHRAVPELQSVSDYTAIWHGVPIGAPVGSTPAFVGLANAINSQSTGALAIEYTSTSQLQVVFRSATLSAVRAGSFTWANVYGKAVTLIASYSADENFVRLRIGYDGMAQDIVASAVSSGAPPTLLGTEQFIVGPDVIEQPSRHINAHVGFAGVFYGRLRGDVVQSVLRNPWQLFKPASRSIIIDLGAGGGGASQSVAFTLDGIAFAGTQTAGRTQSLAASLDGVSVTAAQTLQHSQSLAAGLDGVTFAASQQVAGAAGQTLAITLDDVAFAASQTLAHAQAVTALLDDVDVVITQGIFASSDVNQTISLRLDDVGVGAFQSLSALTDDQLRDMLAAVRELQAQCTKRGVVLIRRR